MHHKGCGQCFKLFFEFLKNHKGSTIIFIVNLFLGICFIVCKFLIIFFNTNWWCFKCFFTCLDTQNLFVNNFYFFQTSFFHIKGASFFFKLKKSLNIDDYINSMTWKFLIHVYNTFWHFWFNCVFYLEIFEFWICVTNPKKSFLCDKEAWIIYII
jgi:hypothetical protein